MTNKSDKPSVEEILVLYDETKKKYEESGLWEQWEEDEVFYELAFKDRLNLPKEFKNEGIVLPTARDLIDVCVDHTDISNVRVWANRRNESEKSEEEMNLLRKFGLGVLYRNNVEAPISPIRVGAKHYWLYGLTVLKTVWDADRYADRPQQKEKESEETFAKQIDQWRAERQDSIPIVIQSVNPKNILLDPFYEGGMFVFEVREELCFNVHQRFPKWSNPNSKKVADKVEHISFWTKDYRCELYDREPVLKLGGGVVAHAYGFIPYVPINTGLGNVSSDNDMKKKYVGIMRYVRDILISESRDYSIGDVILKRTAFPWGYLKGTNAQSVTQVFQKFGEYNALPDGVDIVDMNPKVPPDALLTWLSVAASYLASHAAPPSIRGQGETGVRSGADRRLLISEASTKYQYSNEAFRHGVAKVLSNCARIMKNVVPGDINVWAKTPTDEFDIEIKKDQMKEPFTFYVEFAPISEEDEYRRHSDLISLLEAGVVTKNWARKQMSNVDPIAMELEEEVQRMKEDPFVQQVFSQYLAGKAYEAISKRSSAESLANPPPPVEMGGLGQPMMPALPTGQPGVQPPNPPGGRLTSQIPKPPIGQGVGGGGNRL